MAANAPKGRRIGLIQDDSERGHRLYRKRGYEIADHRPFEAEETCLPRACGVSGFPETGANADALLAQCRRALGSSNAKLRVVVAGTERSGRVVNEEAAGAMTLIAESPSMKSLLKTVDRVASANLPVLLLGETGTGKEVIARALHERGPRHEGPLVALNCGGIPPQLVESTLFGHERGAFTGADKASTGVFGAADGGTVLLDEIGELPLDAQASLLRALETGTMMRVGASKQVLVYALERHELLRLAGYVS